MEHATICHLTYKTCSHKAHEELRSLKQTMRWKKLLSLIKQSVILPLAGNILCMVFKIQTKVVAYQQEALREHWAKV